MTFKIIMSPSKTQHLKQPENLKSVLGTKPSKGLQKQTTELLHRLKGLNKEELGHKLNIKGKLLEETYALYHHYEKQEKNKAISLYTGSVFKGLKLAEYDMETVTYMEKHLRILSAFYGVLKPLDEVRPYRLDMTGRIFESGSYAYWKDSVNAALKGEQMIVNLASEEFSQLVSHPMVTLTFKEKMDGKLSVKSTYAKIARGKMIDAILTRRLENYLEIKELSVEGYVFLEALSSEFQWVYVRETL